MACLGHKTVVIVALLVLCYGRGTTLGVGSTSEGPAHASVMSRICYVCVNPLCAYSVCTGYKVVVTWPHSIRCIWSRIKFLLKLHFGCLRCVETFADAGEVPILPTECGKKAFKFCKLQSCKAATFLRTISSGLPDPWQGYSSHAHGLLIG